MNVSQVIGAQDPNNNFLNTGFIHFPETPYIVFNPSNVLGRAYPRWDIVFALLRGPDGKLPFSVIQVSNKETQLLKGAIDARGLPPTQISTLTKNSLFVISGDSFLPHYCADNLIPCAAFYGFGRAANFAPLNSANAFNSKNTFSFDLTSKQHQSPVEAQKELDNYSPFAIFESIECLNGVISGINRVKHSVKEHIGVNRSNPSISVFPDFAPPPNFLNGFSFDLRLDKVNTPQYLLDWCRNKRGTLFIPKVLKPEILKSLAQNIANLQIADDPNLTEEYLHFVKSLNINPTVIAAKERVSKLRNKFFDFQVIEEPRNQEIPDFETGKFISSQAVMSGGKVYPSIGAAEAKVGGILLKDWDLDYFYKFQRLTKEVLTASRKELSSFYINFSPKSRSLLLG